MRLVLALVASLALAAPLAAQQPAPAATTLLTAERWDRAAAAWEMGQFDAALLEIRRILASPNARDFHERIAELTGEIWQTVEVAQSARAPRWSPDGRVLFYETGTGADARFVGVQPGAGFPVAMTGKGGAPTFAPDLQSRAYLEPGFDGRPVMKWKHDDRDTVAIAIEAPAATAATLFGSTSLRAAVITGTVGDSTAQLQVRSLGVNQGAWTTIPVSGAQPVGIVRSPDGGRLFVLLGARGAFARGAVVATAFAELGDSTLGPSIAGNRLIVSRDGWRTAWVEVTNGMNRIMTQRAPLGAVELARTPRPVGTVALSPDGATLAFVMTPREDSEIFTVATSGGSEPRRITHDPAHDLAPQFLTNTRLLGVVGEARHRRSFLYDLERGTKTRLFHNNTVRTVAPEYEWAVSPDGSRVAIVSERDGDTITPHRHLYFVDLNEKVTPTGILARVEQQLALEQALRARAKRIFTGIAPQVRAAADEVSTARLYDYQQALFAFDSKHISQPGNWKATNYLLERYKGFGLDARLQRFTVRVAGEDREIANVVATVRGTTDPELVYVVGAHFDSRAEGPGADDNTSGTAMILEAARVIAKRPLPATVMFVAFTGEESGLLGSREFSRVMKDSINVVGALNNDMMGYANDHRLDNTIRYSNSGLRDLQHAAALEYSRLTTYDAYYYKSTDAHSLYDAWGDIISGIGSYPILANPHYHQPHDVLETINQQLLTEVAKTTVASIMLMASSPSRLKGLVAEGTTATWDPAVERGAMRYIVRWGPADEPRKFSQTVANTRATLAGAKPGWRVEVKAVNAKRLEGWDWARAEVK